MQISIDLTRMRPQQARMMLMALAECFVSAPGSDLERKAAFTAGFDMPAGTEAFTPAVHIDDACSEPAVAQAPLPQPVAPSTAAVQPLPTVPMDPLASFQMPAPVASPLAPPIAQPAIVPMEPAVTTMPASGVDLDTEGMPWDARIHASTKTKTQAGVWKAKKGASAPTVEAVRAELKALMSVQAPAMPAAPPAMPIPGVPADNAAPVTLSHLMTIVTNAMLNGTLPQSSMLETIQAMGLPSIPSLSQRPDMIPAVYARLVAKYPAMAT